MKIKGTVENCGKGKFSYFVRLENDPVYYNTKYEPKCGPGDVVGIEFESKGPNRAQIRKIKMFEDNGGASKTNYAPKSAPSSSGGYSSAPANTDRQDSIVWQHSQEIAIRVVSALLDANALPLPAKGNEQYDAVLGAIDSLTNRYFHDAIDPRKSKVFVEKKAEEQPKKEKEDQNWDDEEGEDDWGSSEGGESDGWD